MNIEKIAKEILAGPIRNKDLTFDKIGEQFDSGHVSYAAYAYGMLLFTDKEKKISITLKSNGTWIAE